MISTIPVEGVASVTFDQAGKTIRIDQARSFACC
jgi:hypothetical protein